MIACLRRCSFSFLLLVAVWLAPRALHAQTVSPDRIWQSIERLPDAPATARRDIQPTEFKTFTLDVKQLRSVLSRAPIEATQARVAAAPVQITLPMPDGTFARFEVEESTVMAPELAAKYPDIKTYYGRGVEDRAATVVIDVNSRTFHAQILRPDGAVYIDPYWHLDGRVYMSYAKTAVERDPSRFKCLVEGAAKDPALQRAIAELDNSNSGRTLRTYRLACATSIQYSRYHSADPNNPTVPEVLAAVVTMVNRVSGIYRTELGIRMVLVPNNDQVIATVTNPGPFTDTPGDIQLNPPYCDTKIGAANYDIGHVVTVGSGGIAGLGVVCQGFDAQFGGSAKAAGTTGFDPPVGDPFWVDYVAHEMGHQFGGNHTFNGGGTGNNCSAANQNPDTAYEPGSGSTIQAYAGICGAANNLQPNSDPYFHFISLEEMFGYASIGAGGTCPAPTATGNTPPTVSARGPGVPAFPAVAFTIPDETPFSLKAFNGSDAENDPITYCWEEADLGPEKLGTDPDNGSSALFRSFLPNTNPTRTFPRWPDLLANNTQNIGEKLPLTTRKLDFRVTVRDNIGGFGMDSIRLNVVNTGTGFKVTSPDAAETYQGGSTQTVTWDVAGTTANGINTSNVNILLTTDATPDSGEPTFPIVLAANTPNDGSETVTIPLVSTTKARVKIEAVGNVYFDVSNANFTINAPTAVTAQGLVSRKTHGSAGTFDVDLPLTGLAGVESRSGGSTNAHTLVFKFANTLASVGGATVTTGTGNVSSSSIGADSREYVVNLTGVANAQEIVVTLANVTDTAGNSSPTMQGRMVVLVGDTTASRSVNSSDIGQTKVQSGQPATASNFRTDVNANGIITSTDISLVKANSGSQVP